MRPGVWAAGVLIGLAVAACRQDVVVGTARDDDGGTDGATADPDVACAPVDIILVVDNSQSFEEEVAEVRDNLNPFVARLEAVGLDLHVVLISCLPGDCAGAGAEEDPFFGLCVPSPLGAPGGCEPIPGEDGVTSDHFPPRFFHVMSRVPGTKDLQWVIDKHPAYAAALRPGSRRHVLVVSNDGDEMTAAAFDAAWSAADDDNAGYRFHGIFAPLGKEDACALDPPDPCCDFAAPGGAGTVYAELAEATGGATGDLCAQDFDPFFDAIAENIVSHAAARCAAED